MPTIFTWTGSNDTTDVIHPKNKLPLTGLGIQFPLTNITGVPFESTFTTLDMAKSNLLNLIRTEPGERVMQPDFGIGLKQYLFENIDESLKLRIQDTIISKIGEWLPYINVVKVDLNIDIVTRAELNRINITITFELFENPEMRDTLTFTVR